MKKTLSIALLTSILTMNFVPCFALAKTKNEEIKSPAKFESMVTKNKKESDVYKYDYVNLDWWKSFNDSNLNDYLIKAVINNYDLKMATITTREYYQNVRAQFASQLPQVTAGYSPNYMKMPGATNWDGMFAMPAIVNYEADIFLKNRDKTKSVKKLYEASILDERAAYISVAAAVGTTYLNIVSLDRMIQLQDGIVALRQEIYNLMLQRNKEGITSTSDTVKANKALIAGQTELIEYKKQRQQLAHQLAVLIGESPETAESLAITPYNQISFSGSVPSEISTEVITQRPDYLKAEKMVEKAGIDVRVAKKEFLPSINLTGLALFNSSEFGSLWTTRNMLASVGGAAMLPLFTGGSLVANLKIKKEQYEKVLQNYYKTNLTSMQEINDSLVAIKMDDEKLDATKKQQNLEKADFGYNQDKYNQGVISKLDLIQVKENLMVIDKAVTNQQINCYVDYIGLYKATGSKI